MALIDLKTDLKSLKYGRDELGGGNSGQPYIQSDINLGNQTVKKNDDGLIRGGAVGAAKASTNDLLRIGKFLKDAPKGPLFIIKQVGLQLSNPKLESRQFTTDRSTRGLGLFTNIGNLIANTANRISNEIGPTRVYNLGVNTALQIPVNAFGVHFNRHGLLPTQDDQTKYLAVVTANNKNGNNRLTKLTTKFTLGNVVPRDGTLNTSPTNKGFGILSSVVKTASKIFGFKNPLPSLDANQTIADYIGGPGSTYGIGRTRIARYDNTANYTLIELAKQQSKFFAGNTREGTINDEGNAAAVPLEMDPRFYPITNGTLFTSSSFSRERFTGANALTTLGSSLKNRSATDPQNLKNDLSGSYHWNTKKSSIIDTGSLGVSEQYGLNAEEIGLPSLSQINQNVIPDNSVNPKLKTYQKLKDAIDNTILDGSNFSGSIGYNPGVREKYPINYYNTLGVSTQYGNEVLGGNNIDPENPLYSPKYKSTVDYSGSIKPEEKYNTIKNSVNELSNKQYLLPGGSTPFETNVTDDTGHFLLSRAGSDSERVGLNRTSENFKYYGEGNISDNYDKITYNNTNILSREDSDILQIVFRIIGPFNQSIDQINLSAYLNGFKDDFSSTWNEINYAGRAESFYVYDKFKRNVSFNLQIPCFNREELFEKHRALGQLASTTAGQYNNNFLGGVLIKLNVGNYISGEYAKLDNLSYSIVDNATWDVNYQLSMYLEASFQFTIIHQSLPEYQNNKGFFEYLPDNTKTYLSKSNRSREEQIQVAKFFAADNTTIQL